MTKSNAKARPFYRRTLAVCALSGVLVSTVGSAAFAAPTADAPTHKTSTATSSRVTFDKAGVPSTIKSVQEIERIALKHASEKYSLRLSAAKQEAIAKHIAAKKAQIAKQKAAHAAAVKARATAKAAHDKAIRDARAAKAAQIAAAKKAAAARAAAAKAAAVKPVTAPKPVVAPTTTPVKVAPAAVASPTAAKSPVYTAPAPVTKTVTPAGATAPVTTAPKPAPAPATSTSSKAAKIASAALAQIGVKQDCTMLVTNSLKSVGINFHGWPADYLKLGTVTNAPVPGDLIYYRDGGMGMAHIAVYIGNGKAVHGGWNGYDTQVFSVNVGSGPVYIHVR